MANNNSVERLSNNDAGTIFQLPTSALVCIILATYLLFVFFIIITRQFLINRGICSGICSECMCCPNNEEECSPCCLSCLACCDCKSPRLSNCLDCLCPVKKNLTCMDIVFCQCCELDCCGGQPLCEVNLYRLTEYPETYCECCVAINNRKPLPGLPMMGGMVGAGGGNATANPWAVTAMMRTWQGQGGAPPQTLIGGGNEPLGFQTATMSSRSGMHGHANIYGGPSSEAGTLSPGSLPLHSPLSTLPSTSLAHTEQPRALGFRK